MLYNAPFEEVLPEIPSRSIDLVLVDLPYGTTNCAWDTPIDLNLMWPMVRRVAKKNAAMLFFAQTPFDKVLGASNIGELRYEWIWEKHQATGHLNANLAPLKAHENILVFYQKAPTYNPIKTGGHERKTVLAKHRLSDSGTIYNKHYDSQDYDSQERYPRSVLSFKKDSQKMAFHESQKPVALLEYLIRTYSNEGDTVLDFTMGSGTTGLAATNLNRKFIGIEKDAEIFKTAKQNLWLITNL